MKRKMKAVAALSLAAVMLLAGAAAVRVHRMEEAPQQQTQLSSRKVQKPQHRIQERR